MAFRMKPALLIFLILAFCNTYSQKISKTDTPAKLTISQKTIPSLIDQTPYVGIPIKQVFPRIDEERKLLSNSYYTSEINYVSKHNLHPAFYRGKMGFLNDDKQIVIPFQYTSNEDLGSLTDHDRMILKKGGFYGVLNKYNQIIIPFENKQLIPFIQDNYFVAKKNNKIGLYDKYGNVKIPFEYDSLINKFSGNSSMPIFVLMKYNKIGVVSIENKIILPFEYDFVSILGENPFFYARNQTFSNVFDQNGRQLFKKKYSSVSLLPSNLFYCSSNNKFGVIDLEENIVVPFQYDYLPGLGGFDPQFSSLRVDSIYYRFGKNKKIGLYDSKSKKEIFEAIYDEIVILGNDYFWVEKDDMGQIYKKGELAFSSVFKSFGFKNNAISCTDFKDNIVDLIWQKNELVIFKDTKEDFKDIKEEKVSDNYGFVVEKDKWGYKSPEKDFTIKPLYDSLGVSSPFPYTETLFLAKNSNKYGVIDKASKELIPIEFDEIKAMFNSYAIRKKDKWAIYDLTYGYITDFSYKKVRYLHTYNLYYLDGILCGRIGNSFIPFRKN